MPLGGSFKPTTRFTLDLNAIPAIRKETPFPIFGDPSHGTGRRDLVLPMARAAIAAGAHGLMVEVHDRPQEALSDGPQAVLPEELKRIIKICDTIHKTIAESDSPFSKDVANGNGHS